MCLRVVLTADNIRRLVISEDLTSVKQLKQILKENLEIKDDFLIQFEDPEFGNELCNLTTITELPPDRAVLKIIQKSSQSDTESNFSSLDTSSISSSLNTLTCSSQDLQPVIVRQCESLQWPSVFVIPEFAYDVELRLEKANKEYKENGKLLLTMSSEMKMDILANIAQTVFTFKAYPTKLELESVASALIEKHPCLRDPGPGPSYHSWTMSIIYKIGNYRQKLQSGGCSEVLVNRKRAKNDCRPLKKARRCEVNFPPDNPSG